MDRDVEIAYIKETIKSKDAILMSLARKIEVLGYERWVLRKLPEADNSNIQQLKDVEEDLIGMRKREDRLAAEVTELKGDLSALKNPKENGCVNPPVQGINCFLLFFPFLFLFLFLLFLPINIFITLLLLVRSYLF